MKLKFFIPSSSILLLFLQLIITPPNFANQLPYTYIPQPPFIDSIIKNEKTIKRLKNLLNIINQIDNTYNDIHNKLLKGQKIVIFFDPAHGKLKDGRWESIATGRVSCTNLPEEYYSIILSKKLYKLLTENKFIEVKSTEDFLSVMKGKKNEYLNIPFTKTVEMACNENAFILISEHLNNVSSIRKASGLANIKGIHITLDEAGNKYLAYVNSIHNGFLTLYNKFDPTEFSKVYANKLKQKLLACGMRANTWEHGTVADDRFSYFTNFPISIIFESGFISNPTEEANLRREDYQENIVKAQYNALIEAFKDILGIDISGDTPDIITREKNTWLNLLKLSRISIYYIKSCNPSKAISIINLMEKYYGASKYRKRLKPYRKIKKSLIRANKYYKKSKKSHNNKKAANYLFKAKRALRERAIFVSLNEKYNNKIRELGFAYRIKSKKRKKIKRTIPLITKKARRKTPIILAIEDNQTLEQAINNALSPNPKKLKRLLRTFKNAYIYKKVKVYKYSKKRKKTIYYWKWKRKKVKFHRGIYIVKLNKNLVVKNVKRTSLVSLNPWKYQNQQYLKNSYFANRTKQKNL